MHVDVDGFTWTSLENINKWETGRCVCAPKLMIACLPPPDINIISRCSHNPG